MNKKLLKKIEEAKDVSLYKKLLDVLSDYCNRLPATGVDAILNAMIDKGKSAVPSDKAAQAILSDILKNTSGGETVQKILNARFATLPAEIKPRYKNGRKTEVAFWTQKDDVSDKVFSLLNLEGGRGRWTNEQGETVQLIGD